MRIPDERVWAGVDVLLDDHCRAKAGDKVIVTYTPESREPAAWITTGLKLRGIESVTIAMNAVDDETFAPRLAAVMPKPDQLPGRLVIITVERDTMSHTQVFRHALSSFDKNQWSVVRIINASEELFALSMKAPSELLSGLNTTLLQQFMPAKKMRIKTAGGTDLQITLDSEKYRWISNRGVWRPGMFMILPAGEVATYPLSVDGVLVVDGAFNVNVFTNLDARLAANPIKVHIKDSKAVHYECANPQIIKLLEMVFARPGGTNVGELGFGTNPSVEQFVSMNSHINERQPGVHIGFGQHNQSIYLVEYDCDIHMDMIATGGQVWVDDQPTPIDLRKVQPSTAPHPTIVMDEDIDGDCCGLWLDQLEAACDIGTITPAMLAARKRLEARRGGRSDLKTRWNEASG